MNKVFRRSRRLTIVAVLFSMLVLQVTFAPTVLAADTYCVAGSFQSPNQWDPTVDELVDDGTNGDAQVGDGIYSLNYTVASAGTYDFKIVGDCNWGNEEWPAGFGVNAWFITSSADQVVTFTMDTNSYNDGYYPTSFIFNVENTTIPQLNGVGTWETPIWTNNDPATQLQDIGGGFYELEYQVASPGYYEGKIVENGSWDRQFAADGRTNGNGGQTVQFGTSNANETVKVTLDTNSGRIRFAPQGDGDTGASQDNNVWWGDLGHDSRNPLYRSPTGSVSANTDVVLRFRAAENDLTAAQVRVWNDRLDFQSILPMTRVASDGTYEWWELTLDTGTVPNVFYYRFIAIDGTSVAYYEDIDSVGGWGETIGGSQDRSWQLTVYDPAFQTPDWVKNAIVYQIFPDRFRDGDPNNNLEAGTFFYEEEGGTIERSTATNWNTPICDPRTDAGPTGCEGSYSRNFYGGDLQGIIDQLDYLQSLGIDTIYLNPIFESPSNHKYDTRDFSQIDDNFGDLSTFQTLISELDSRGMYIILDGVFNHTSSDSFYFDRYNRYDDVTYGVGACESVSSPRENWYTFFEYTGEGDAPCSDNRDYPKWFGIFDSLPVLRTNEQPAQDLVWGAGFDHTWSGVDAPIGPYWATQGIDGWRLDVAPEVDHGIQSELTDAREPGANDYWENFRAAVHAVNPNLYIVGEEWGIATSWTSGGVTGSVAYPGGNVGEWDATMNYQQSSAILSFWRDTPFTDNDFNSGSSAGALNPLGPSGVNERLLNLQERYSPEAFYAMMNLFGSHDTNRALFLLDHGHPSSPSELTRHPADNSYDWSDAITRLKGAALMQMTLPGAPTIYYGDEIGTVGQSTYSGGKWEDDPYNRVPYPWLDETGTPQFTHLQNGGARDDIYTYYQTLTATRETVPALRTGSFDPMLVDDANNLYAYGRRLDDMSSLAVVIINRATSAQSVTVNVAGYAPDGAVFDDALTLAVETYTADVNGDVTVASVPEMNGVVLVLTSTANAIPDAVTDLSVTGSSSSTVDLGWTGVDGAVNYDVYRSIVSGGGYEYVGNSNTTTFNDSGLTPGQKYYYVIKSQNSQGVVSEFSNEAMALPQWDLSSAWYNLETSSVTHVISTENRTDPIYGQLYIGGGTEPLGPVEGIIAQVGYGSSIDPADGSWTWVEMEFDSNVGNNDRYVGTLLPMEIGTFNLLTRYSSDGGSTWVYGDTDGAPFSDAFGTLTVDPSDDGNNPTPPGNLTVDGRTSGSIELSWEASSDTLRAPAVAGYRVYRKVNGSVDDAAVIDETDASTTGYTDTTVVANETYDYYVTAYDTSFNESDPSNTVTATAEDVFIEVTFVTTVPEWTPGTVHIVGDQQVWGPWDPGLTPMTQIDTNVWQYTTTFLSGTQVEFKHTRGNWDKVEKDADGFAEISHKFTVADEGDGKQTINTTLLNWRDPIVVSTNPEDSSFLVPVNTTVSVTWNKSMGSATEFTIVDSNDSPIAGSYAYDNGTFTTTFTPDADLPIDVFTVTVSGFSVGGDNQQVSEVFVFSTDNSAALPFNLLTPADGSYIRRLTDISEISWESSTNALTYTFVVFNTSNNARLGEVLRLKLNVVDVCGETTGVCVINPDPSVQALFATGEYMWTVLADGLIEALNGPYGFTVNTGIIELLENGGMEIDGNLDKVPDGWNSVNLTKDKLKCNKNVGTVNEKLYTPYGNCAFLFKSSANENSRLIQKPDSSIILNGDVMTFRAMVDPRGAVEGTRIGKAVVKYTDDSKLKLNLTIPSSTLRGIDDYVMVSDEGIIDLSTAEIQKLKVILGWRGKSSKFFIDEVSLTIQQSAGLIPGYEDMGSIPLPQAPDGSEFRRSN